MKHSYSTPFMSYTSKVSSLSADAIVALMAQKLNLESVLDVGCAVGTWLDAWRRNGVDDFFGLDGDYVDPAMLAIPRQSFRVADLSEPFDLGRKFDIVQSLEVAEHLPRKGSESFVACLASHSRGLVLFSAAPPGQGGEFHVNERPMDDWRALFAAHGYVAVDWLRNVLKEDSRIAWWYRYNVVLYVHETRLADLPSEISAFRLESVAPLPDVSPPLFQLRKLLVRAIPVSAQNFIARMKARLWQ
jgi:SAM-dependent methyltransferase